MSLGLGYIIGNGGVNWKHMTVPDEMNQNYHHRKATEMSWNLLIPMWLQLTFEWCPQSWQGYVSGASPRPIIGSEYEVSFRTCLLSVSHLLRLLISTIAPRIYVLIRSLSKVLWNCWKPREKKQWRLRLRAISPLRISLRSQTPQKHGKLHLLIAICYLQNNQRGYEKWLSIERLLKDQQGYQKFVALLS